MERIPSLHSAIEECVECVECVVESLTSLLPLLSDWADMSGLTVSDTSWLSSSQGIVVSAAAAALSALGFTLPSERKVGVGLVLSPGKGVAATFTCSALGIAASSMKLP